MFPFGDGREAYETRAGNISHKSQSMLKLTGFTSFLPSITYKQYKTWLGIGDTVTCRTTCKSYSVSLGCSFPESSPRLRRAHFIDTATFGSFTLLDVNQTNALVPTLELNFFDVYFGFCGVSSIFSCLPGSHTTLFNALFSF